MILELFEKVFPLRKIEIKYSNKLPWVTTGLRIRSIKQKRILQNKFEKDPTEENKLLYKRHRNLLTTLMRNSERLYYENQLELQKHDLRKSWKIMKEIIGKVNESEENNFECIIEGSLTKDVQQIAKAFNNYFTEIGPNLASKIISRVNPIRQALKIVCFYLILFSIVIPNITCHEVYQVICSLKNSSAGWDDFPTFVLKKCSGSLLQPLTHLINCSLQTGIFPDELKLARVVPIFKAGDPAQVSNYRPISVLTTFSKIIEKIVYNHLLDFLSKNEALYKYQFGFRPSHSTQQAIITLVDRITKSLDNGNIAVAILLDLKKAFDTLSTSNYMLTVFEASF